MKDIICPNCDKAFKVDKAGYADILKQVHNDEFEQHVNIVLVDFFNATVEEKGEPVNMKLAQAPLGTNNVVAAACEYTTRTIHRYNIFRGKSALTAAPGAHSDIRKDAKGLANALLGCRHETTPTRV